VKLRRIRWSALGDVQTPIDAKLDAAEKTFTRGLREMLCRLNQSSSSFRKTAENLHRLTSLKISGETARKIIEEEGNTAAECIRKGQLDFGWTAEDCTTPENKDKTRVYFGCDGVRVPVVTDEEKRKRRVKIKAKRRRCGCKCKPLPPLRAGADQSFKEIRIVTVYDESQEHRAVAVSRGDCEATGRLLRTLATILETRRADETIANIDGAPWIRNQLELHQSAKDINLDYYHLKDYAQRTRREVFGESTPDGQAWLERLMSTVMEKGIDTAWNHLVNWCRTLRGRKRKAADKLLAYVTERREIIRYKEFRAKGWQIGSGPTEAQCKTTTLRVKGRGRRWDLKNAEAVMALAAIEASNAWNAWWANPIATAA
jgi:hypothetical protein